MYLIYHRLDGLSLRKLQELVMDSEAWLLRFMGSQRVGHDWATELNWTECITRASLAAQAVKNLPAVQETRVWSLGREDPLEEEMAALSSTLAWKISRTEEPGGLQSWGRRVGHGSGLTHLMCNTGNSTQALSVATPTGRKSKHGGP